MEYTYNILDKVYNWMISKEKDVEVRILKEKSSQIQIGDYITFNNMDNENQFIKVKVINKKQFDNVNLLLEEYSVNRIMPKHNEEELKELLNQIYNDELLTKPLIAFEFEYLYSDQDNNCN